VNDLIRGYSRGMYSNWLWHKPLQLIVDAGEGLQLALGTSVFAPDIVAITHGHSDHVLGLPGFLAARRFGKGAVDKPVTVLYPAGSRGVDAIREWLARAYAGVEFPVAWTPVTDGMSAPCGRTRSIEAFSVRHTDAEPALGYRVVEIRRRLRAEFAGRPQAEIEALARQGQRDLMTEDVRHIVFAHTGDAMPVPPELVTGADLLVHDATFLVEGDRKQPIHATTNEALATARDAGVGRLVLQHLSIRYDRRAALPALRAQVAAFGFTDRCWLLDDATLVEL
jgi:ribonuclease Z